MMKRRYRVAFVYLLLVGAVKAWPQSDADRRTLEKARAMYYTHPLPAVISCGVTVDWDGFLQRMKTESNDATKARVEKLKAIKIAFVTDDHAKTVVTIDPSDNAQLADGIRQQLRGFFQIYRSFGAGKVFESKPGEAFAIVKVPSGYIVKAGTDAAKVEMDLDATYLMKSLRVRSAEMNAEMIPDFKAGSDGLYRLHKVGETIAMGETKMVVDMSLDYQTVEGFEIPQHVTVGLPGSYSFDYTFKDCEVKGSEPDASQTKP